MKSQTTSISPEAILNMTGAWPQRAKYATIELTLSAPYRWDTTSVRFFYTGREFTTYYESIEAQINAYAKDKNAPAARGIKSFEWVVKDNTNDPIEFSTHVLAEHNAWPNNIAAPIHMRDIKVEPRTDAEPVIKQPALKRGVPERLTHGNPLTQMESCIKQYNDGLVTLPELLMKLQLTEHQAAAVVKWSQLPYAFAAVVDIKAVDKLADAYLNGDEKPE